MIELARRAEPHRCARVDDHDDRQVAILVKQPHEHGVEPREDVPVDEPQVVARHVRPEVRDVEAAAART